MIVVACSTGIRSTASLDVACRAIAELGFRHVDPLVIEQWHIRPSRLMDHAAEEAAHARETLDRHGLACAALNLGFLGSFTACSDAQHRVNLQVIEGACLLARTLGTSTITVGPGGMGAGERGAILDRLAARLNEALTIASGAGMTLALETHAGAIVVYPDAARDLLARCPGLKLTYDPSHYIAEQIPVPETLNLLDHTAHVHLRNARVGHFQERMDRGALDMGWMIRAIVSSGYDGAISIEYIQDCGGIEEGYEVRAGLGIWPARNERSGGSARGVRSLVCSRYGR
jgi:sugar phosphate isomerase/epimerase